MNDFNADLLRGRAAADHPVGSIAEMWRELPAGRKLAGALLIVVNVVLLPANRMNLAWTVVCFLAVVAVWSRMPWLVLGKRLAWLSPFVLGVAVAGTLHSSAGPGWWVFAVKSTLCLTTAILLSHLTPFGDILRVLQRVRTPWLLLTTLALMHRYLFVLADETARMRRARSSRMFRPAPRLAWSALGTMVGLLFVRASERAERIYDAMGARGWK